MAGRLALVLLLAGAPLCSVALKQQSHHEIIDTPKIDSPIQWVPYDESKRFDKESTRACLTNKTVLVLGNSVARHWYFTARGKLGENVCLKEGRKCEKSLCGSGGGMAGGRDGQGGCLRACGCDIKVGAGTHLAFLWQQRIFDPMLRESIDKLDPDMIVMNAGGDDIFANTTRDIFRERFREQAPLLRDMLNDLLNNRRGKKPIEVYWRTTTAVCKNLPHFGVEDVSTLNPLIEESNSYVVSQLADVPNLRFLDGYNMTTGRCNMYDDDIHHSTIVYSHLNTLLRDYCLKPGRTDTAALASKLGGHARSHGRTEAWFEAWSHGHLPLAAAAGSEEKARWERLFGEPWGPDEYPED